MYLPKDEEELRGDIARIARAQISSTEITNVIVPGLKLQCRCGWCGERGALVKKDLGFPALCCPAECGFGIFASHASLEEALKERREDWEKILMESPEGEA